MTYKQNDIWLSCIAALAETDNITYYEAEQRYGKAIKNMLEIG